MSDTKTIREEKIEEIKEAEGWECQGQYAAKDPKEFENQYIARMLADYIGEDNNYVVDRAVISCSHMSREKVEIVWTEDKISLILRDGNKVGDCVEVPNISKEDPLFDSYYLPNDEEIGILHAVHALEQSDVGLPFATVIDCTCQRDVDEGKTQDSASILSLGNCSILRGSDIQEIEKRKDKAVKYGTCYCLMKPVQEWINPFCMESVMGDYRGINIPKPDIFNMSPSKIPQPKPQCKVISHHKTMEWSTNQGQKEGLTMLSTLLCARGGIISIEFSGQSISRKYTEMIMDEINVKEEILRLLEEENGLQLVTEYLEKVKEENPGYTEFLELLAMREGGGDYSSRRQTEKEGQIILSQFLGRYQVGDMTLKQIGFKDTEGHWTELAESLDVKSEDDFLINETAQEVAILFALRWDYQFILSNGDDKYIGSTIAGVEITESGMIASGHLIGCNDLHKAFNGEIAWSDAKDGLGTSALEYMKEMGGLNLREILVGIE